jgi:hypothetical protein
MTNLKGFVNDKRLWDAFTGMLDEKIGLAQRKLENAQEIEVVYRAQGEVAALRRLKYLRDEVNGSE